MAIAKIVANPAGVASRLKEQARQAEDQDGARAIVLGCTEIERNAARALAARVGVPVIDPNVATMQFFHAMADMG